MSMESPGPAGDGPGAAANMSGLRAEIRLSQDSLKGLVLQNQIGAAGNLIGKSVEGLADNNDAINGVVDSVRVQQDQVYLELHNGTELQMGRVTKIASPPAPVPAPATAAAA